MPKLFQNIKNNNKGIVNIYNDSAVTNDDTTFAKLRAGSDKIPTTSLMLQNSQKLPLVSGPRDVDRIQKYLLNSNGTGVRFIAFQQQLQAGNTFGQSRLYNALSVPTAVLNYSNASLTRPLERVSRIISNNAIVNPNLQGRIQKETVIDTQGRLQVKYVGGEQRAAPSAIGNFINGAIGNWFGGVLNRTTIRIPGFVGRAANFLNSRVGTNFSVGKGVNLGQVGRTLNTVAATANAFSRGVGAGGSTLVKDQTAYDALYIADLWPMVKLTDGTIIRHETEKSVWEKLKAKSDPGVINRDELEVPEGMQRKIYDDLQKENVWPTGKLQNGKTTSLKDQKAEYVARASKFIASDKKKSSLNDFTKAYVIDDNKSSDDYTPTRYIQDVFNVTRGSPLLDAKDLDGKNDKDDYIKVKFVVPGVFDNGIYFRAFIEDLQHTAKGQYDEVRYVGRPERFITYRGMNRSVTFSLFLVAFAEAELDTIWTRANMLNKLVYPIDNAGGFMIPPITKLTIGNVIINQPGYVENVDMRFQDIPWDIDKELPKAIKLNMTFNIIEKEYITQNETNPEISSQLFNGVFDKVNALDFRSDLSLSKSQNTSISDSVNNALNQSINASTDASIKQSIGDSKASILDELRRRTGGNTIKATTRSGLSVAATTPGTSPKVVGPLGVHARIPRVLLGTERTRIPIPPNNA